MKTSSPYQVNTKNYADSCEGEFIIKEHHELKHLLLLFVMIFIYSAIYIYASQIAKYNTGITAFWLRDNTFTK